MTSRLMHQSTSMSLSSLNPSSGHHRGGGVKCSIKVDEGHLFCLDQSFTVVLKSALYVIAFDNVTVIMLFRVGDAVSPRIALPHITSSTNLQMLLSLMHVSCRTRVGKFLYIRGEMFFPTRMLLIRKNVFAVPDAPHFELQPPKFGII